MKGRKRKKVNVKEKGRGKEKRKVEFMRVLLVWSAFPNNPDFAYKKRL